MISDTLQKAIDNLHIQDVYQRWNRSQCAEGFYPKEADFSQLKSQQMHAVTRSEVLDTGNKERFLRVMVVMGVRWVEPSTQLPSQEGEAGETSGPDVRVFIEAEFVAEYRFITDLPNECLDEFAQKNASYHIWPYWREFLMSQSERLRLPRVILNTMQLQHHARLTTPERRPTNGGSDS